MDERIEHAEQLLKPVIRELVRTKVLPPQITLLVDKISIVRVASPDDAAPIQAYRLCLTDLEKTIQAVFKRRIYKQLASLEIRAGSYIRLTDYKLVKGPRLNGKGNVNYLTVADFQWMGEERRYELQEPEHEYFGNFQQRPNDLEDSCVQTKITPLAPSTVSSETSVDETIQPKDQTEPPKPAQASPQTDTKPPLPPPQIRSSTPSPWSLRASTTPHPLSHISTPLTLSSLSSITGPHRSRNRLVSVLALVHSVDPDTIKRPKMPLKRDIRITDTSTDKIVTLSIFTTPLDIIPSPESIVLFRNVTTHDFKGGNLNAYPKQCEGKDWCIPDPFCVSGTHAGLEETRRDLLAKIEQTRAAKGMTGASDNNEMQQSE